VLLLGGTTEGRELMVALVATGIEVIDSVAGRTAEARTGGAQRIGGFGVVDRESPQRAVPGRHRRVGQLVGIHLAEALVALGFLERDPPLGELGGLPLVLGV